MNLPWVSRYRLRMAELEIEHLRRDLQRAEDRLAELATANTSLQKLYDEEKDARREAERKAVPEPEESASRRRVFGVELSRMATKAMTQKAIRDGKIKR